ncbi:MAG: DUF58 domain-containing protein [Burkholderiales bacterium]|nr:DUF58 domain-containing protein [Burkholderiales bacterium]
MLIRGFGIDLADLREYQHGDDARTIDWNATARFGLPHVRQHNEDREVAAWFLVDLSGSVNFGSGMISKRSLAVDFIAVMSRLLTRHGNRAGAVLYTDGIDTVLPARGGRRHVVHLIDRVAASGTARGHGKPTQLGDLFARAAGVIKRRSLVFAVSDFISEAGWAHALASLGQRHEVIAVRLLDAVEMELPDLGMLTMEDAETGQQLFVDTHDAGFRRRFATLAAQREADLRAALAAAGADCIELSASDDLANTLVRFARLRKRRAQMASGGVPAALME